MASVDGFLCKRDELDGRIQKRRPAVQPAAECQSGMKKRRCEENGTSSGIPCSPPPRGRGTKRDRSQEFGGSQEPKASNRCEYQCNEALNDKSVPMVIDFTLGGRIAPGYYFKQAKK